MNKLLHSIICILLITTMPAIGATEDNPYADYPGSEGSGDLSFLDEEPDFDVVFAEQRREIEAKEAAKAAAAAKQKTEFGAAIYGVPKYLHDPVPEGWTVWRCEDYDLPCGVIEQILDSKNRLWIIGSDDRIVMLKGDKWTTFNMDNTHGYIGNPEHPVSSMAECPKGTMLFAIPSRELIVQYKLGIWSEHGITKDFEQANGESDAPKKLWPIELEHISQIIETEKGMLILTKNRKVVYKDMFGYRTISKFSPSGTIDLIRMRNIRGYAAVSDNAKNRVFDSNTKTLLYPDSEIAKKMLSNSITPIRTDRYNTIGMSPSLDGSFYGVTSLSFEGAYHEAPTKVRPDLYPTMFQWDKTTVYGKFTPETTMSTSMPSIPSLPGMGIIPALFALLGVIAIIRRK